MLERECLTLDKNIADCIAEDTYTTCKENTLFGPSIFQFFVRVHERIAHAVTSTDEEIIKLDSDIVS